MKAVKITIKSAGVFKDPRISKTSDKMYDLNGVTSRYEKRSQEATPYIKVADGKLSVGHVANLLRVLCGERPVPQIRKVLFKGDSSFDQWAKEVRVISGISLEETMTSRKSIGGLTSSPPSQTATHYYLLDGEQVAVKGGLMHWDRFIRAVGKEMYQEFVKVMGQVSGKDVRSSFTCQQAMEFLNVHKEDSRVVCLLDLLKKPPYTSFYNLISNTKPESITFHVSNDLNKLLVCSGVEKIKKSDYILWVPATEAQMEQLSKGTGIATFHEGGVACIEDVEDWTEIVEAQSELTVEGELCTSQS